MKHLYYSYNQLVLLYRKTLNKYQRLVQSQKNYNKQSILKKRLLKWNKQLLVQKAMLRKGVVAASLVGAGLFFNSGQVNAQSFAAPVLNPFGLDSGFLNRVALGDLDNDGDLDMITGEYNGGFMYYKNSGTSLLPAFDPFQYNPFSLTTGSSEVSFPAIADLDNDGDLDIMLGTYYGNMQYYQNTGSATVPVFAAPVDSAFGFTLVGYDPAPSFADLDNDGDLDMMVGEYYGDFYYFQNTGSVTAPAFAAPVMNPFGLANIGAYIATPTFADLDNDGDLDLLSGEYYGDLLYFENTGSASVPAFAAAVTNPFSLTSIGDVPFPCFGDLDNDGDMDIMTGEVYGAFNYFENTSPVGIADNDLSSGLVVYPNPAQTYFVCEYLLNNDASMKVFNMFGQLVYSAPLGTNKLVVNTNEWPSGTYTIQLTHAKGTLVKKLIKQ